MELFYVIAAVALVFFIWKRTQRTRCPQCGTYANHPVSAAKTEQQVKSYELEVKMGGPLYGPSAAPGGANEWFHCLSCSYEFKRQEHDYYLNLAIENQSEEYEFKIFKEVHKDVPLRR